MRVFHKVSRSNRVTKLIEHSDKNVQVDISEALDLFYGEGDKEGVDQYLKERFLPLTFTDPNAWFLTTFDSFDSKIEQPQPYPVEYSSEQVINYELHKDRPEWVIVKLKHEYINRKEEKKTTNRYILFDKDFAIEYIKKETDMVEVDSDTWTDPKTKYKYLINRYEHKSGRVPLIRIGYKKDIETQSQTYVNPFHYEALPLMEQFLKISSELQLSITLHTFPKQVSYVEQCDAKGCQSGVLSSGETCATCSGTGKKLHTTAADVIEIPMPRRTEDMVDVSKISTYVEFPAGVMEFLDKYADKLEDKIMRMMFNSESLVQTQFNTATEAVIDVDSIYDTLHPFADKYSDVWMFFVKLVALYRGHRNVIVVHKFASDLKLKPMTQLLNELKLANESNAPSYVRETINEDIADIIYADDQDERSKLAIKSKHYPFSGKTDFEIQNIILNNLTPLDDRILYANFNRIFDEVEIENPRFYEMAYTRQKDLIQAKIEQLKERITPQLNLDFTDES